MKGKDLFILIKHLTKSERRYFKLFASIHRKNSNLLKLFNAIRKQQIHNERGYNGVFKSSELHVIRNRLYKLILKSLASYSNSIKMEVQILLSEVEILFKKSLYKQCYKILLKAKKIACEREMHFLLLEILEWEYKLARKEFWSVRAEQIIQEEEQEINRINNHKVFRNLSHTAWLMGYLPGVPRKQKDIEYIHQLIQHPYLQDERKAESFQAKQNYYYCHTAYYAAKGDFINYNKINKKRVDLYLSHPERIKSDADTYCVLLDNLINSFFLLKKYNEARYYINQLKEVQSFLSLGDKTTAFFNCYNHESNYYIYTGQFEQGIKNVASGIKKLSEYENRLNFLQKMFLYLNNAILYFGVGHYSQCCEWLNRIRNDGMLKIRSDLGSTFKIIYLIAHYEKGNVELLPYLIKSTHRHLSNKKRLYKFENILLDFLGKRILKINSRKTRIEAFKQLKNELEILTKDPYEKRILLNFDFLSWAESKIQNRTFAEIVKEKSELING